MSTRRKGWIVLAVVFVLCAVAVIGAWQWDVRTRMPQINLKTAELQGIIPCRVLGYATDAVFARVFVREKNQVAFIVLDAAGTPRTFVVVQYDEQNKIVVILFDYDLDGRIDERRVGTGGNICIDASRLRMPMPSPVPNKVQYPNA